MPPDRNCGSGRGSGIASASRLPPGENRQAATKLAPMHAALQFVSPPPPRRNPRCSHHVPKRPGSRKEAVGEAAPSIVGCREGVAEAGLPLVTTVTTVGRDTPAAVRLCLCTAPSSVDEGSRLAVTAALQQQRAEASARRRPRCLVKQWRSTTPCCQRTHLDAPRREESCDNCGSDGVTSVTEGDAAWRGGPEAAIPETNAGWWAGYLAAFS